MWFFGSFFMDEMLLMMKALDIEMAVGALDVALAFPLP